MAVYMKTIQMTLDGKIVVYYHELVSENVKGNEYSPVEKIGPFITTLTRACPTV